ncbi:MAG: hypothetical protein PWQ20_759 [Thermotogaceae bacterium]|nr:hypothetical protein [Thermotogaceae bacterium]MDN5337689.1 hypothetical protein [Thermotogaceae bacterium]
MGTKKLNTTVEVITLKLKSSDFGNERIFIFLGPFGSGKTELSINFALWRKKLNKKVSIADLDIISPYFRVRDHIDFLSKKDITVIAPPKEFMHADLPIIPPKIMGYITNTDYELIMDIGGENDGAMVLGMLKDHLSEFGYTCFAVLNTRRPFYRNEDSILELLDRLQSSAKIKINYLINNTNIGKETTVDLIEEGEDLLKKVSEKSGIPIAFSVIPDFLDSEILIGSEKKFFRIKRFFSNDQIDQEV